MDVGPSQIQNLPWLKGDWCFPSNSRETDDLLRQCIDVPTPPHPPDDLVEEVMRDSELFPIPFPVENIRLRKLRQIRPEVNQTRNIATTYPIIHERVLLLMASFIVYKREFGSAIEKTLYKEMTISEFVDRLLLKRAITFCGPSDMYKLITGEEGHNGWDAIGTINQKPPLLLESCLSYDEMRISAMLFVSGHTAFINDGERHNEAEVQEEGVEKEGVIIGLIGTRLERPLRMEYEDLLITSQQNTPENGYGEEITPRTCLDVLKTSYVRNDRSVKLMWRQMWAEFYQVPSYAFEELGPITQPPVNKMYKHRFVVKPNSNDIFDNEVFYKRMSIPLDCALLEANARAEADGKMAYLNIVGIGLGVWRVSPHQTEVFVLALLHRVRSLMQRDKLRSVSDVNIAYVKTNEEVTDIVNKHPLFESAAHPTGGIRIHQVNREPSSELTGAEAGRLLVTTYAWDGNAHPGNEFWMGSLSSSGDPAAACSTQVAELHNAHVNARYLRASNLRVAGKHGLLPLQEYASILLGDR